MSDPNVKPLPVRIDSADEASLFIGELEEDQAFKDSIKAIRFHWRYTKASCGYLRRLCQLCQNLERLVIVRDIAMEIDEIRARANDRVDACTDLVKTLAESLHGLRELKDLRFVNPFVSLEDNEGALCYAAAVEPLFAEIAGRLSSLRFDGGLDWVLYALLPHVSAKIRHFVFTRSEKGLDLWRMHDLCTKHVERVNNQIEFPHAIGTGDYVYRIKSTMPRRGPPVELIKIPSSHTELGRIQEILGKNLRSLSLSAQLWQSTREGHFVSDLPPLEKLEELEIDRVFISMDVIHKLAEGFGPKQSLRVLTMSGDFAIGAYERAEISLDQHIAPIVRRHTETLEVLCCVKCKPPANGSVAEVFAGAKKLRMLWLPHVKMTSEDLASLLEACPQLVALKQWREACELLNKPEQAERRKAIYEWGSKLNQDLHGTNQPGVWPPDCSELHDGKWVEQPANSGPPSDC